MPTKWLIVFAGCLWLGATSVVVANTCSEWLRYNHCGIHAAESGDYDSAESAFKRALALSRKCSERPALMAVSLNNLGYVYLQRQKYAAANRVLKQSISLFESQARNRKSDLANALDNLGRVYWHKHDLVSAEPLLKRALLLDEQIHSGEHLRLVTRLENLSTFYYQCCEFDKAEKPLRQALGIREKEFELNGLSVAYDLRMLAILLECQGKHNEALPLVQRALQIAETKSGANSSFSKELVEHLKNVANTAMYPKLTILRPGAGETFVDTPIVVKLAVQNFKLQSPEPQFGVPTPGNVGHVHYSIDSYPPIAIGANQIMIEGRTYLPNGKHMLVVELVHDTHGPLNPPVKAKVVFFTRGQDGQLK